MKSGDIKPNEVEKAVHFPFGGVDVSMAFCKQPNRPTYQGKYARTCVSGVNVVGFDRSNVFRGGSRTGLVRYIDARVGTRPYVVQALDTVTGAVYNGSTMQYSQAGRVVTLVAVSQGQVRTAVPGDTSWTTPTNVTGQNPPLNSTGIIFSAENALGLWFADGTNWVVYDPVAGQVKPWIATAGTLPVDGDGNKPRLIGTWRGRTVLSGLLKDPQNWFMSAVGNPRDFDYSPVSQTPTSAVAGNSPVTLGLLGDIVTAIIPHTDDILIMGGDHSITAFRGDPMDGGRIDNVSNTIGIAWGQAWCKDPMGNIYFLSNKMGMYVMAPGQQPQRISQAVEQLLYDVDIGSSSIRLQFDDRYQSVHVWITTLAGATQTDTHYTYEVRSGAFWQHTFANKNHNPGTCCTFDGNLPSDRVCLIGSWDGYVRALNGNATQDDGYDIVSTVVIGPILTDKQDKILLKDVQAVLDTASGDVDFEILVGETAQEALESEPLYTGTWEAGRSLLSGVRSSEHALYLKITSTNPWSLEQIRLRYEGMGKVARRS